jgi:TPR repeat protein
MSANRTERRRPPAKKDERMPSQVTKSAWRAIILAGALALTLGIAVCQWSGWFATANSAPGPVPNISAVEALGRADEAYHRTDYAEAMYWYRRAADQGNSQAQNNIGWLYEYGRGVALDYSEVMRWFRLAAEQGSAPAQCNIGLLYENARGMAQDYGEAMRRYRIAADNGGVGGQINVGRLYENGRGVPQDYAEAMRWYRKAADQGEAAAQYHIGWLYENGWGVAQDYSEAARWYRMAVDQGNAAARAHIGRLYMRWYREAADQGMPRRRPLSVSCSSTAGACRRTTRRRCAGTARPRSRATG